MSIILTDAWLDYSYRIECEGVPESRLLFVRVLIACAWHHIVRQPFAEFACRVRGHHIEEIKLYADPKGTVELFVCTRCGQPFCKTTSNLRS